MLRHKLPMPQGRMTEILALAMHEVGQHRAPPYVDVQPRYLLRFIHHLNYTLPRRISRHKRIFTYQIGRCWGSL